MSFLDKNGNPIKSIDEALTKADEKQITVLTLVIIQVVEALLDEMDIKDPEKRNELMNLCGEVFERELGKLSSAPIFEA